MMQMMITLEIYDGYLAGLKDFDKKLYDLVVKEKDKDLLPYKNYIKEKDFLYCWW